MVDESKNVQTTPTRTDCKRSRPLPYFNPNCRTPWHWKFTQHHRTTRPPPPIITQLKVKKIRSDQRSEFVNKVVQNYLKGAKKGYIFFTTNSPVHAALVERSQATFKKKLYRYLRHKRNNRYIDDLQLVG